ncbi:MAG: restriction endonuclease subunit S [Chloroflexota bacterium]
MSNKMDSVNNLLPKLRFPEFQNSPAWKKTPLEDAVSPVVRQVEKPENPYTGLGIRSHGKGTFLKPLESPEKNAMEYLYEVQSDDLIVNITFAWEGAIAIVKQGDSGALVSHRFPTYTFNRDVAIPEFFQYVILDKRFIYNLGVISPGGAGRNRVLNKNDFLKLTVSVPSTVEQQKIADCLTALDDLIAAQSQKVEALQAYKKGLLQNLFPADGESVPRLRFPEFQSAGEWEEKTIGQISENITAGGTPNTSKKEYWNGNIRWMNSGELNYKRVYEVQGRITEKGLQNSSTKIIPSHCVLIGLAGQGKTRGTVAMNMIEVCTNQSIAAIFPNEQVYYSDFLYHNLDNRYDELRRISAGGEGRGGLNLQIIKSLKIILPSLPEQQRIAELLSAIDEQISAQGEVLAALKVHKKGLMQGLFPSMNEVQE